MTPEQLSAEWQYRFAERIAILTDGQGMPTNEQVRIAKEEFLTNLREQPITKAMRETV